MQNLEVLFANSSFIAIHKDPGIPCQSRQKHPRPLDLLVPDYLSENVKILTRLDQPVSGIVFFQRENQPSAKEYRFKNKIYLAFVEGKMEATKGVLKHRLKKNEKRKKAFEDLENGKKCQLEYEVVSYFDKYTLVKVNLQTGRFHQIRAQLSLYGHPIKGDVKYGARRKNNDRSIHLHAFEYQMAKNHSIKDVISVIDYSFPNDALWNLYAQKLLSKKN